MRIRTLKPDFWQNAGMAGIGPMGRLLAIALLNWADDEGYFLADARLIRGALFPFEDDFGWIEQALSDLSEIGYVHLAEQSRNRVGKVVNFRKHQRISKPQPSKLAEAQGFQRCAEDSATIPQPLQEPSETTTGTVAVGNGSGKEMEVVVEGEGNHHDHGSSAASDSGSEPKEAERWLSVDSEALRSAMNRALRRRPAHRFSGQELHDLGHIADASGMVPLADIESLGRFLAADPPYDSRDEAAWQRIPKGSLLRQRKRLAARVLADLANQIAFAKEWEMEAKKISAAAPSELVEPDWDWRAAAAAQLGWDIRPGLTWNEMPHDARRQVLRMEPAASEKPSDRHE